jgi:hypothetical protein
MPPLLCGASRFDADFSELLYELQLQTLSHRPVN